MYMMNDREFSNRKETLHGEFYEKWGWINGHGD